MLWPCLATLTKRQAEAIYEAANARRETHVNPPQVIKPAFIVCEKTWTTFDFSHFVTLAKNLNYLYVLQLPKHCHTVTSDLDLKADKK